MLTYKPASGKRCFVGDMTDIFGEWVPDALLDRLFTVFAERPDVTWQVLTKRANRMRAFFTDGGRVPARWPLPNVWLGVSCEDQQRADERIPHLLQTPAAIRFISAEPLLTPPGEEGMLEASRDAGLLVVGLSTRWHREGLGQARLRLAREASPPTLLVRRGLRPGGLAPPAALTRFTWSIRP